jgi:hypothetical protein
MKECDKRKRHINSKLLMIYISSDNVRHPVTKTFTTLHPTTLHIHCLTLLSLSYIMAQHDRNVEKNLFRKELTY